VAAEGMRKLIVSNWPVRTACSLRGAACRRWPELDAHKVSGSAPSQRGNRRVNVISFKNAAHAKFSFPMQSAQEARTIRKADEEFSKSPFDNWSNPACTTVIVTK